MTDQLIMKVPKYVTSLVHDKLSSYNIHICYQFVIDEIEDNKYSEAYANMITDLVNIWVKVIDKMPEDYSKKDPTIAIGIMTSLTGDLKVDENRYMAAKLVIEQLRKLGAVASIKQLKEVLTELANAWGTYTFEEVDNGWLQW